MAIQKPEDQPTLENNDIKSFPKTGFGNLNAPPGYSWTPKWKDGPTISRGRLEQMRANNAGSVGWDKGKPVYNPPGAPDLPRTDPGEVADWDYQTSKIGKYDEELPKRAVGWKADGTAYYGPDNFYSTFNKMLDRTDDTIAFTRSDEFKEEKWYEKLWQLSFGKASMSKTMVANTGTLVGDTLSAVTRQLVQRPFGTMKMTADDLAEYSKIPDVTQKIEDYRRGLYQPKGEFRKLLPQLLRNMPPLKEEPDKAPPLEWLYDFIGAVEFYPHDILRTIDGTARALGQGVTLKDILILGLDNLSASRMFYSMGENDYQKKQVFLDRVRKGEDPNLVAFDMEQPLSQLAGYAIYDPLNLFDLYGKAAKTSSRIASAAQRSGTFIPELQNVTEAFIE